MKILRYMGLVATMLIANSCSDLLEETPRSKVTPSSFNTPAGLLGGIVGPYNEIRNAWGTEGFTVNHFAGTDEYLMGGSASTGQQHHFTYNGLNGADENGGFGFYSSINTLNGVLLYGQTAQGLDEATKNAYLGQAHFLRAFLYFYLVQTYGNIPLSTEFLTTPLLSATPVAATEVYAVIVQDLTDAIATLPDKPTAPFWVRLQPKPQPSGCWQRYILPEDG